MLRGDEDVLLFGRKDVANSVAIHWRLRRTEQVSLIDVTRLTRLVSEIYCSSLLIHTRDGAHAWRRHSMRTDHSIDSSISHYHRWMFGGATELTLYWRRSRSVTTSSHSVRFVAGVVLESNIDRKSTRLNSSHSQIS